MTYSQAVEWMFQQLPMYQRVGGTAYKKDLSNIDKLSRRLNNPHKEFKSIHVAGTNGKGSVSHMLASILQESGYKTGLYTSPHLKDFRERIRINGREIDEQAVIEFIENNKSFLQKEKLSFFEMTVGMAFDHFAINEVDIAVIEVGLGGRLDSTNIIVPQLSIITNIGLDHTGILGNTLSEIAAEKAGIIKEGVPVVIGESLPQTRTVFEKIASEKNARLYYAEQRNDSGNIESDLRGDYQKMNIRTVLSAIEVLRLQDWEIPDKTIENGLNHVVRNTGLRGRWEVLNDRPKVICDTAHNKEGLLPVIRQLMNEKFKYLHIVLGVVKDKDLSAVLPVLPTEAIYYFCKPDIPRGMDPEFLSREAGNYGLHGEIFNSVKEAYAAALEKSGKQDLIYIGGSNFTVAEVL